MSLFGLEAAPAHLSPQQGKSKNAQSARAETLYHALQELASSYAAYAATHGLPMKDISGPNTGGSSAMGARSAYMESRLRQRMGAYGSPEYELHWKYWPMPLGEPILALRASARQISDREFIGWPTPCVPNGGRRPKGGMSSTGATVDGKKRQVDAEYIARQIVGWPTPVASDTTAENPVTKEARNVRHVAAGNTKGVGSLKLGSCVLTVAGWATPKVQPGDYQYSRGDKNKISFNLSGQPKSILSGPTSSSSLAENQTEPKKSAALNPEHSLWLMGIPKEWASSMQRGMRSTRGSRRNS